MGYAIYQVGPRHGGYGVPAVCEKPECDAQIDRGISYACGGEPFSEHGCDRYFCEKHRNYTCVTALGDEEHTCELEQEDDCEYKELCERCSHRSKEYPYGREPFDYKPETQRWLYHLVHDFSWAEWRRMNIEKVEEYRLALGDYKPDDDDTQEKDPGTL